jgi:hypothetical protein
MIARSVWNRIWRIFRTGNPINDLENFGHDGAGQLKCISKDAFYQQVTSPVLKHTLFGDFDFSDHTKNLAHHI